MSIAKRANLARRIAALALLIAVLTALCACAGKSSQFVVEYVGTANIMSANIFAKGNIGNESVSIGLSDMFKDCTVENIAFPDAETMTVGGTEDGNLCYSGGIIATFCDASGNTFDVTIKEGSTFDTVSDGDTVYLLPPQ